ncbi:hypothetical protein V2J09_004307 [Rumex salicifolius]
MLSYGSVSIDYLLNMLIMMPYLLFLNLTSLIDHIHTKRKWMTFTNLCVSTDVQFNTGRNIIIPDENMCEIKRGACGDLGHEFDFCSDRVAIPPKLQIT